MMYLNSDLCSASRDSEKSLMPCMVKGSGLSSLPFLRGQGKEGMKKWSGEMTIQADYVMSG